MKASYRWICELIPELRVSAEELATRLTGAGLAVDGVSTFGAASSSVLVARVTQVRPHPERSNLRLVTVDCGTAHATIEVVCGAPNVPEPGGLVVFAPVGTELPAKGLTITPRKVGGIESRGMLCSEAELGLSDDASGLLVLPADLASATPGTPLAAALPATQDIIYELDLTPNRPDALGHIGIARDVAALFGLDWTPPPPAAVAEPAQSPAIAELVQIDMRDLERCSHFGAAAITDVKIEPSPAWLRYRLSALGVRPISNVVDITNLLMLEFGHPMHAYDLDRVQGARIIVRRAQAGERLTTLDGAERTLSNDDLVIADAARGVGLAGVMGGADSEVHAGTRRVLFECAYFDSRGVRRSSRRHGLHTEASHRFERGVDPDDAGAVLARAVKLTETWAHGVPVRGQLHVGLPQTPRRTLHLPLTQVSQLVGEAISDHEIQTTLTRLGCQIEPEPEPKPESGAHPPRLRVSIPNHRPDLTRSVDLVSEVARIRGIDRVEPVLPRIRPTRDAGPREALNSRLRAAAVDVGLSEAITYAFVAERDLHLVGAPAASVVLKNPINELHTVMRTSLLPGLFEALARARRHGRDDVRLFTLGARYLPGPDLPDERMSFAAVIAGARAAYLQKPAPVDVWDGKGLAEALVQRMTRRSTRVQALDAAARPAHLHPRGAGAVLVEDRVVGSFGPLHPDLVQAYELDTSTQVVELDAALLLELGITRPSFQEIPRFPASWRDLAVVVSDEVQVGPVLSAIREAAGPLAEHVELFDRFVGGAIPEGHASLAFRVVYRAPDRTLTDAEVDERHGRVVSEVERNFAAQLRRG